MYYKCTSNNVEWLINFKVNGLTTDTINVAGEERIEPVVKYEYINNDEKNVLRVVLIFDLLIKKTVYIYIV